jgi:hypothetical protein
MFEGLAVSVEKKTGWRARELQTDERRNEYFKTQWGLEDEIL